MTIAVNLAAAVGTKAALFDLDPQESAVIWADRRKAEIPHVEFPTKRRLPNGLGRHGRRPLPLLRLLIWCLFRASPAVYR
jgi:cellulose biosynthesis protein BcsQ